MPPVTRSQKLRKKDKIITKPKAKIIDKQLSVSRLNIKELLARLNLFNTHYRTGNLKGLSEVILAYPRVMEVTFENLLNIKKAVSSPAAATTSESEPAAAKTRKSRPKNLILDFEFGIRRSYYMTLYYMLEKANIETTDKNLFEVLRGAIDHIMKPIPIMCMRTFLCFVPSMIKNERHRFVHDFLDVWWKMDDILELGKTHFFKFKGQIINIKSRVEVLHHLKYYLNKFLQYNNIQAHISDEATTKIFDPSKMDVISLFNPIYTPNCQIALSSSTFLQDTASWDDVGKFREYTDTTMSLLFGSWLEFMLLKVYTKSVENEEEFTETVITEEAALLLKYSLEVFSLIWALVKYFNKNNPNLNIQNDFSEKYCWAYVNLFFNGFPYVTSIETEQKNENAQLEDSINDPKLVAQNLEICQVYILLYPNIDVKRRNKEIKYVMNYIEDAFYNNTQAKTNDVILKILQTLFSYEHNNWTSTLSITECLFSMIVWAYFNEDMSTSFRQKMFTLLCEIGMNDKLAHFHRSDAYKHWLNLMPELMQEEPVVLHTLGIIQRFAARNNLTSNMVANSELVKIIETDPIPPPPIEPQVPDVDYRCLWLMDQRDNENRHENRNICI